MPFHNGWLPREGFTSDALGPIIRRTALNPAFTLALVLLARYTKQGSNLAVEHPATLSRLQTLFYFGLFRWATKFLDNRALNNSTDDPYDWNREIVLVTGGAGGIGGHVVKLFAERGIRVVVLDVIPMTFETPTSVSYYQCDITSSATIAEVASKIRAEIGEPTILINNAGVARGKSILDSTEKDVRFTFEVNTMAHYWLVQQFLPSMIKQNHGMVVTVASIAAYITVPNMVDYAASKAAALSFHEGLTAELPTRYNAPKVRTVVVNQGYTRTPLFQGYQNDAGFLAPTLELESVAEAIAKQVLSGKSGQIVAPGFLRAFTGFRAMPHWLQLRVRGQGERIMKNWNGRQVIDVEKWKADGEQKQEAAEQKQEAAEKADVSASTVLVEKRPEWGSY